MVRFLNKLADDTTYPWAEWQIQAFVVQEARRRGFTVAGDMNQGRRSKSSAGLAKATGMLSGEPDLRFYMPNGRLVLIELKVAQQPVPVQSTADSTYTGPPTTGPPIDRPAQAAAAPKPKRTGGTLSAAQREHHARLASLGFIVHTVYAATPWLGWVHVCECLGVPPS